MMKRLLVIVLLACLSTVKAQFASIGIIGSATPTAWDSDIDMITTDGVVYTLNNFTLTGGEVKFRKDNLWTENWGGTAFPSGTAIANGSNLNVVAGVYNITFNLTTLQYSFADVSGFQQISLAGDFNNWVDVPMNTTDGITYTLPYQPIAAGGVKFKSTGSWSLNWGGATFPSGAGIQDGQNITVPEGTYKVTFNRQTLAYNFGIVGMSIIGPAASGWSTDIAMATTDGVHYTLQLQLAPGELKFRANNNWDHNWGGVFPDGTAVDNGSNFIVNAAGLYSVTFNLQTKEFSFAVLLATQENTVASVTVYPNPSSAIWNFSAQNSITELQVTDISGKVIFSGRPDQNVISLNAESFSPGIYFAKVTSGKESTTIKLVKK